MTWLQDLFAHSVVSSMFYEMDEASYIFVQEKDASNEIATHGEIVLWSEMNSFNKLNPLFQYRVPQTATPTTLATSLLKHEGARSSSCPR